MKLRQLSTLAACLIGALLSCTAARAQDFVTFESGQVRPLALSPDGTQLFAVNTPDNQLEIFSVGASGLTHTGSVPVGLEPVAVAARTNGEVWVVNHLSDSVSIVDVSGTPARVIRTLLVGDEPRDIVFAGSGHNQAFITTAHRGQNSPVNPQLTTAGVGRADVWVFNALSLGASLGGTPATILTLFGDTPRALAATPDGSSVYAAVFHSGDETTTISEGLVCDGGSTAAPCSIFGTAVPGGLPAPNKNVQNITGPETGLIVKFDDGLGQWRDQLGRDWSSAVRFSLPDLDVFRIDATTNTVAASFAHVGTILFNMVVNPISGNVYVTNTEANNAVRFEGPGGGGSTVRGHLHEARITILSGATVTPRHLNKHINYSVVPSPAGTAQNSLAIPVGMAVSGDGTTLYVAAFGSSKVGVFDTGALENDTFVPSSANHIPVTGGGPSGLVLDEAHGRLYVLTRFDNSVSVIDTSTKSEEAHLALHNPEPIEVVAGRHVLYDATNTSSNGEASCASCHIFGDFDSLAWDLGNPDDVVLNNPNPIRVPGGSTVFHPLKGPMTTQSLRGMANSGPMHWRGDRTGGNDPGGDPLNEAQAFGKFIVAFDGLLGRGAPISDSEMTAFTNFILKVTYPPNPVRALDNSLNASQQAGHDLYFGRNTDAVENCNGCHALNPAQGFFGTDGFTSFENETQMFKIPHLRNAYQKVGMFGMAQIPFLRGGDNGGKGAQVRGFGFLHDGSVDTLFRFHGATVFNTSAAEQANLEQFVLAFDSNLAPILGQQITLTSTNAAVAGPRIDLLIARAGATPSECDVVVKGVVSGELRGFVRLSNGSFRSDRFAEATLSDSGLRAKAATAGQELTYTCVPPGSGTRIGIDRDDDGFLDRDEIDAGTDPADPTSFPNAGAPIRASALTLHDDATPPIDPTKRTISFRSASFHGSPSGVVQPAFGSGGDPMLGGAVLSVFNANGGTDVVVLTLPASGWKHLGTAAKPRGYKYSDAKGTNGPIQSVTLSNSKLTVRGKGAGLYPLVHAPQGKVGVDLTLGTDPTMCAVAPAKPTGNPPSTAKNDTTAKFVGVPNSPPPAVCPIAPGGGSPSLAFLAATGTLLD
jgi:YVTN family beta-propeller protein